MSLLKKITDIGTNECLSICENKYIRLTNAVNIGQIFFIALPAIIGNTFFLDCGNSFTFRFFTLVTLAVFNIYLNSRGKYLVSKFGTLLSPFFLIFIFPVLANTVHGAMFLSFSYGIMVIGGLAFMIFSYGPEKKYLHTSVIFFAFFALFYELFLTFFVEDLSIVPFIFESSYNFFYFQITKTLILVFLYVYLFKLKVDYHNSQVEIFRMNDTLAMVNKDLKVLNTKLEDLVSERTIKLETQNKRIKELAYTNSHIIRAYVARINGLINMAELKGASEKEKQFCFTQIKENSVGLENVTKTLSQSLVTEECSESLDARPQTQEVS
ncbi:hypothetical protein RCC89_01915 [Cytophagaceae bacterium ABcell3]|nr:hypothetical protein RCC89_01915 [Cytophagaceae bacterium ABcell3]